MSTPYDPEHGELRLLVDQLDSVQGEIITSDLRDLKIPAVLRRQSVTVEDPDTEEATEVETDMFEILVPEAFWQISYEVLDVTHLKREGKATTAQILEDLHTSTEPVETDLVVDGAPFLRRSGIIGRWMLRIYLCAAGIALVVLVWHVFVG